MNTGSILFKAGILFVGWILGMGAAALTTTMATSTSSPVRPEFSKDASSISSSSSPFEPTRDKSLIATIKAFFDEKDSMKQEAEEYAFCAQLSLADLKFILNQPLGNDQFLKVALDRYFTLSPTEALSWISSSEALLSNPNVYKVGRIVWAYHNPAAALQWSLAHLTGLPESGNDYLNVKSLMNGSIDSLNESQCELVILATCAEMNPGAVAAAVDRLPRQSKVRDELLACVFSSWVEGDQASALSFILLHPEDQNALILSPTIALNPILDSKAWLSLIGQIKNEDDQRQLLNDLGRNIAQIDPVLALNLSSTLKNSYGKFSLESQVLRIWAQTSPEEAWNYATTQLSGQEQTRVLRMLVAGMSFESPQSASTLIDQMPNGEGKAAAATTLVVRWAHSDPEEAAAWVAQQPDDPNKANEAALLMGQWMRNDATAAGKWLQTLPPGPALDSASATYANNLVTQDALTALNSTLRISNPTLQQQTLSNVYSNVLAANPSLAQNWLQQALLPADLKKSLQPATPP